MQPRAFIVGAVILGLAALLLTVGVQDLPDNARVLNFERPVLLSIMTSVAASAAFFAVIETLRYFSDQKTAAITQRLERFEKELGIRDVFSSKSEREIVRKYKRAVAGARTRVWAVGLSNNQFLEQHSDTIKQQRRAHANLDVRVHFFDPAATVSNAPAGISSLPLINLFDFPTSLYQSDKRKSAARAFAARILADTELRARVFFILVPSYFSLMIVDEIAFFFPYLAAPEDASSNPMMMVDTAGEIGIRLVQHVEQLAANPLLCREQIAAPTGPT